MSYLQVQQLLSIKNEFDAARASVDYLERGWFRLQSESDFSGLKFAQVRQAGLNLEATYVVRLFSVFESVLRVTLPSRNFRGPDRRSAYDLINRAASRWHISVAVRDGAHQVREFRNHSVHQNHIGLSRLLFADALAELNRFLSWLP